MRANDLSGGEVEKLMKSYKSPQMTDELHSFGSMLLAEVQQRASQIEAKSILVLGWATGILAFLVISAGKPAGTDKRFVLAASVFSLGAAVLSFLAIRTRDDWGWPSDRSWFSDTHLSGDNVDDLRRFHVRVMHEVRHMHLDTVDKKVWCLFLAEVLLALGAMSFFATIITKLFS